MGKPSSGGGTPTSNLFTTRISGDGTVGALLYLDLGLIPLGQRIWFGNASFGSPDKSITFELRTNNTGSSLGNDASTSLLSTGAVAPKNGTLTRDLYKSGTLRTVSVIGTGVEHFWLAMRSKSTSLGSFMYSINYTLE